MPVEIKINIETEEVRNLLLRIQKKTGDLRPAMKTIGEIVLTSVQRNFEEGGRPDKWQDLVDVTKHRREKQGRWPGQILVGSGVSGGLLSSISYRAFSDNVKISAKKKYAAIHHFGGQAGRGRKVTIPARPYMLLQDEDWREINDVLKDFILNV